MFGMYWLVACELIKYLAHSGFEDNSNAETNYIDYNELEMKDSGHVLLSTMYFMFTTLTTVGLGDYKPINDPERIMCVLILLSGVLIVSYLMNILIELLQRYNTYTEEQTDD